MNRAFRDSDTTERSNIEGEPIQTKATENVFKKKSEKKFLELENVDVYECERPIQNPK